VNSLSERYLSISVECLNAGSVTSFLWIIYLQYLQHFFNTGIYN